MCHGGRGCGNESGPTVRGKGAGAGGVVELQNGVAYSAPTRSSGRRTVAGAEACQKTGCIAYGAATPPLPESRKKDIITSRETGLPHTTTIHIRAPATALCPRTAAHRATRAQSVTHSSGLGIEFSRSAQSAIRRLNRPLVKGGSRVSPRRAGGNLSANLSLAPLTRCPAAPCKPSK